MSTRNYTYQPKPSGDGTQRSRSERPEKKKEDRPKGPAQTPKKEKPADMEKEVWPQIVDIGLNLTNGKFDRDRRQVLERALARNVQPMILTGTSMKASRKALELAQQHPGILYSTVGVHPHDASHCDDTTIESMRTLAKEKGVVAIGECGLDFNRMFSPQDVQEKWFAAQLELAVELQMPVFLHERDAHTSFVEILSRYRSKLVDVVVHCFTGTKEDIEKYLEMDCHIGFTGVIGNKNRGKHLRDILASKIIPLNRLMIETDAPFMTPYNMPRPPSDGRNEPYLLPWVLRTVAECYGESDEAIANATTETALKFFRIPHVKQ